MRPVLVLLLFLLVPLNAASAGSITVGGRNLSCGGVRIVKNHRLADAGYAKPGIIILNPRRLGELPAATRKLIFLHECAHQHVGYDNREAAADCWAVRQGKAQGWLDKAALNQICHSMRSWKGTAFHLPGPARCEALKRCHASAP